MTVFGTIWTNLKLMGTFLFGFGSFLGVLIGLTFLFEMFIGPTFAAILAFLIAVFILVVIMSIFEHMSKIGGL